jgi:hypothetical protein
MSHPRNPGGTVLQGARVECSLLLRRSSLSRVETLGLETCPCSTPTNVLCIHITAPTSDRASAPGVCLQTSSQFFRPDHSSAHPPFILRSFFASEMHVITHAVYSTAGPDDTQVTNTGRFLFVQKTLLELDSVGSQDQTRGVKFKRHGAT